MEDDDTINALFEARGEVYRDLTQQIADMLPELTTAIGAALRERSTILDKGVTVQITDITKMFQSNLAVSLVLEFPLGNHIIGGDKVEVTEENQMMFKYVLHYVYDLEMVYRRNRMELLKATLDQMADTGEPETAPTPKLKPSSSAPTAHDFDLDGLTEEQKEAYLLHLKSNTKR